MQAPPALPSYYPSVNPAYSVAPDLPDHLRPFHVEETAATAAMDPETRNILETNEKLVKELEAIKNEFHAFKKAGSLPAASAATTHVQTHTPPATITTRDLEFEINKGIRSTNHERDQEQLLRQLKEDQKLHQMEIRNELGQIHTRFNSFATFNGGSGRGRGSFRGRGRGGRGRGNGHPGNFKQVNIDVPNSELWKENIERGQCGLHGIRGKNHSTQECNIIKALVEKGAIALNDDFELSSGGGQRHVLN